MPGRQNHPPQAHDLQPLQAAVAQGRFDDAIELARALTGRFPEHFAGWNALGALLGRAGRTTEALPVLQQAASLAPDRAEVHNNLGSALAKLGRLAQAEPYYRKALSLRPQYPEALNSLGTALAMLGRIDEAAGCFQEAVRLQPEHAVAHNNLGCAWQRLDRLEDAEACHRRALQLAPQYPEAWQQLGNTLLLQGRLAEAVQCLRGALQARPNFTEAHSDLLLCLNYAAADAAAADECLEEARRYGHITSAAVTRRYASWTAAPADLPLRVGIVSGDLRRHPVGYFLEGVIREIDPLRIELYAYPSGHEFDGLTRRIRPAFAAWKPLTGLDDDAAAQCIHDDGVHVLLDLSGHTAHNRLPVFARRPAPVQISWLGYFATTGLPEMDYFIADPTTLPPPEQARFTERILYLPQTRLCFAQPDVDIGVAELPALSAGHVTFCCFNTLSKLNDAVLDLWARVLHAVERSVLFLKARQFHSTALRERIATRFSALGIDRARLQFEPGSPRAEYLAAYHRADIALDPFPFAGGTTTAEALWMGVPVLTLAGERLVARQGAGLLAPAGLHDWIARDADDFVARAARHAADPLRLQALRQRLRAQVLASPIFDAQRFARDFEVALQRAWDERRPQGLPAGPTT